MKSKGIKNLLIDLGGVLINLDRERCIENFKKIGFQNIEEKFCTHQLDGIFLQQEKGLITPAEFRDGIREMMGKMVSDKQIDAAWNSFLVDIPTYKLDLLLKLREKYVVYLPEIFKAVTEDAGIDPKETFFIDDSEINCKVAQELGISTYTPKAGEDWSHLFRKK